MGLNFKIQILDTKLTEFHGLSTEKHYPVDTMDHESYFIRHPFTDEKIEVKFNQAKEFRPKY